MDPTDRLTAIEGRLANIEAALGRLVAAWDRFAPLVEKWGKRLARRQETTVKPW